MSLNFNEQQQAIIDFNEPRSLAVLAGPGSGKTATIVERVSRRVIAGQGPRTLMLTFSRKAAQEMFGRLVRRAFGDQPPYDYRAKIPLVTTFHGYGWWLIRNFPTLFGFSEDALPTILDPSDQRVLVKQTGLPLTDKPKIYLEAFDRLAAEGIRAMPDKSNWNDIAEACERLYAGHEDYLEHKGVSGGDVKLFASMVADGACAYELLKRRSSVLDYNDLQIMPIGLFRNNDAEALKAYGVPLYDEVIVDEAQDTSRVQYELVSVLTEQGRRSKVVMVGDDDQTIYGWRGARHENIELFVKEFNAKVLPLTINYRCAPEIVEKSDRLIKNNAARFDKNLQSARKGGHAVVKAASYPDENKMGSALVGHILARLEKGVPSGEIAILARTNSVVGLVERHLIAAGIPYKVHKGTEVLDRKEVQMALSAVRAALNPHDETAFAKLMEAVPGVGKKTVNDMLFHHAMMRDTGRSEGIMQDWCVAHDGERAAARIEAVIYSIYDMVLAGPHETIFSDWMTDENSPFKPWFDKLCKSAGDPEANRKARIAALDSIAFAAKRAVEQAGLPEDASLQTVWQAAMDVLLTGAEAHDEQNMVTLSTAHRAKGLEWKEVVVYGFSEGLFPMYRQATDGESEEAMDIEEERRLAYVALTRAKDRCYLLHADRIDMPGLKGHYSPSRFAEEMSLDELAIKRFDVKNRHIDNKFSRISFR